MFLATLEAHSQGKVVLVLKKNDFEGRVLYHTGACAVHIILPLKMSPHELIHLLVTTSLFPSSCVPFSWLPDLLR